mmetsp:Transcript_166/g.481  ORF Transcript_166/g.481 Transcript_166/m.481 type:complete len:218 (+) Transcript_166:2602-3255(+)
MNCAKGVSFVASRSCFSNGFSSSSSCMAPMVFPLSRETTGCANPRMQTSFSLKNSSTRKPKSGANVWWLPTNKTGRFLVPLHVGTASNPLMTPSSRLVEKNTGECTDLKNCNPSRAFSICEALGGVNVGSLDNRFSSSNGREIQSCLFINLTISMPFSCNAACDAPSNISTLHFFAPITFCNRDASSFEGMSKSFVLATTKTGTRMFFNCSPLFLLM